MAAEEEEWWDVLPLEQQQQLELFDLLDDALTSHLLPNPLDYASSNALQLLPDPPPDDAAWNPLQLEPDPAQIDVAWNALQLVPYSLGDAPLQEEQEQEDWRALPARLQRLLEDLAGNALECLPVLQDGEEGHGGYFSPFQGVVGSEEERRYWRVRMRLLTAIANCRSLVDLSLSHEWEIGVERENEVLVLLRGLASRSDSALKYLCADWCEGFGRQAAFLSLGQLVACNRRLRVLWLRGVGMKAAGVRALADGFHTDSPLKKLDLSENEVGDVEGAQQLARILFITARTLKALLLEEIGMDVEGAKVIADALSRCGKLQVLEIGPGKVEHSSPSPSGLGPVSTLLQLALTGSHHRSPWFRIRDLTLWIEEDGEAGLADALSGMFCTNRSLERLATTPYALNHGLDALHLSSNIESLHFSEVRSCETKVWMLLIPLLQHCNRLTVLGLTDVFGHASFKTALVRCLEYNESLTELYIDGWDDLNDAMFADLIHSLHVNPRLQVVSRARTAWALEEKDATINRVFAHHDTEMAGRASMSLEEWRALQPMPIGLQELLIRLRGPHPSISSIKSPSRFRGPNDIHYIHRLPPDDDLLKLWLECDGGVDSEELYGGYFIRPRVGPRDEGTYWRVRKRVVAAIANCQELKIFNLSGMWDIGVEREEEVLLLMRGLASLPALMDLNVDYCEVFGRETACVALREVVASSRSLRSLSLREVGLSVLGLGVLAEGFVEGSVLEKLDLSNNKVGDAAGAQHLARILATAPQLWRLHLEGIGMDVAGAQVIANALRGCARLQSLGLGPDVMRHCSPSSLGPVSTVLKLGLTQAADENGSVAGIRELALWVEEDGEAGLADALRGVLRSNATIQHLETTPYAMNHGLDALRHNSTIYRLRIRFPKQSSGKEELWTSLVLFLQQCKALRVLDLSHISGHASFKKALLGSLENNAALHELNIDGWDDLDDDLFTTLMKSLRLNRTLRTISIVGTSWAQEIKEAAIKQALTSRKPKESLAEEDSRALPPGLQQLLDDLAGNALKSLPSLDDVERYGDYFSAQGPRDHDVGRYRRVRMRVVTAIANCRSLVDIKLFYTSFTDWRQEEFLVLLQGLEFNPVLRHLSLHGPHFKMPAACTALGELVASSRTLRSLDLSWAGLNVEGLGFLAKGFNRDTVLEELDLSSNDVGNAAGAQQLALILANAPQLKHLRLQRVCMTVAGARVIANALPRCATLRYLEMSAEDKYSEPDREAEHSSPSGLGPLGTVLKLALTQADENGAVPAAGITDLKLRIEALIEKYGHLEAGLAHALAGMLRTNSSIQRLYITPDALNMGLDALRHNSTIRELRFIKFECADMPELDLTEDWMRLVPLLKECKSLRVLDLTPVCGAASFKTELLRYLEHNTSLNELNLDGWDSLRDEMFKDLMHSLDVNRTLRKISISGTSWELDGKGAIIDRALARNATQQAYLPLLLNGQVPVMPKAGRLFLCGAPFAGKTTLRKTMVRACKGQTASSPGPSFQHPGTDTRTEGIEIEVLRNDDDMQITIWDLAGQAQYRALQDHLFPTYNQACVFLFSFNPFDAQHPDRLHPPEILQDKFRTSLAFWLRFINSNCRSVGSTLPQVFVVVTHVDQLDTGDAGILPNLLQPVLRKVATEFEQVVHVTTTPLFCIDARSANTVEPLLVALLESFRVLFATKLFWVPEVCNRLSAVLTQWVSQHPAQPIMKKQQALFADELQIFHSRGVQADDERFGAILAYLHDVGNIICIQGIDVVVLNPDWISHTFLGGVIKVLTESCRLSTSILSRSSHGFVAENLLHSTLDEILEGTQVDGIERKNLVSLMTTLNLCYAAIDVTRGDGFFVPFTLDDGNGNALGGKRQLTWKIGTRKRKTGDRPWDYCYIGRRLQCSDKTKTFLGPGFFPRFQVSLRKGLLRLQGMQPGYYSIERNLIRFYYDGMEILLESSGDIGEDTGDIGDHVDILVRSCTTKDNTIEFLKVHVIKEIRSFCASPEGSPGVQLAEGILRTECVEDLTLCLYRRNQSVLTQDLMDMLLANQKHSTGEILSPSDLADYRLPWLPEPEADLGIAFEEAKNLLSASEVSDVLRKWQTSLSLTGTTSSQLCPQVNSISALSQKYPNTSVEQGKRRGLGVIVSIEDARPGGAVDRGRLEVLLKILKFQPDIVVNNSVDIKAGLKAFAEFHELADDDCFLYCVNAHGGIEEDGREYIYISAGKKEKLYINDDILKPITECRFLANKPKVFIINACRGTGSLVTNRQAEDSSDAETSKVVSKRAGEVRPLHFVRDCLVIFSTSHGEASLRDVDNGTNFIMALMEALVEQYETDDVLSILTTVIGKVTKMEGGQTEGGNLNEKKYQCPELYSTLIAKLYWS